MTDSFEIEVLGLEDLNNELSEMELKLGENKVVEVSFGTNYGLYVHEDMEASHVNGEAKYLTKAADLEESAVIENFKKLIKIADLGLTLFSCGAMIQRRAQKLVPVDTGNLKGTAMTEVMKDDS